MESQLSSPQLEPKFFYSKKILNFRACTWAHTKSKHLNMSLDRFIYYVWQHNAYQTYSLSDPVLPLPSFFGGAKIRMLMVEEEECIPFGISISNNPSASCIIFPLVGRKLKLTKKMS